MDSVWSFPHNAPGQQPSQARPHAVPWSKKHAEIQPSEGEPFFREKNLIPVVKLASFRTLI
jgi:hypothetical protein